FSYPLLAVCLLEAAINFALVLKRKAKFFSDTAALPAGSYRQLLLTQSVLWFALCEVSALLAFIFFLLTAAWPGTLALIGISVAALTFAKPSLSQLEKFELRFS